MTFPYAPFHADNLFLQEHFEGWPTGLPYLIKSSFGTFPLLT